MKEFLEKLLETCSPSGDERDGINLWDKECEKLGLKHYYQDKMGNSAWAWGNGPTKLLLSGHIDEITMAVNYIEDDGYIVLTDMAGIDSKVLPGSQILLMTDKHLIKGMIVSVPIHIYWGDPDKRNESTPINELRLDIGAESKEDVLGMGVNIGTPAVFERNILMNLGENRLTGNALDDKVGVAIVYKTLKYLSESNGLKEDKYTVIGLATVGEESGLRGAIVASKNINPDISIDIDVIYANCGMFDEKKYGDYKLGKGVIIEYGQDKSRKLSDKLKKICEENDINYQISCSRCGGTNTDSIQLMSQDCETTLISLPITSLHTQNETMDWRDIRGAENLLRKYIEEIVG